MEAQSSIPGVLPVTTGINFSSILHL
jgi:hypothetical protein